MRQSRRADSILALKANHGRLYEQVVAFWDGACARLRKGPDIGYHREWSEGHGRDEFRRCWATSDQSWLEGREEWKDLKSVVMVEAERFIGDRLSVETRYYISSLENDAKLLNESVRSHWGVEIPQSEDPRGDNLSAAGRPGYHRHGSPARSGRVVRPATGPRSQLMFSEEFNHAPPRPALPSARLTAVWAQSL